MKKLETFCLEDNSDDDSLDQTHHISIQTEIKYKQVRDIATKIILCYAIDFDLPIISFLQYLQFVRVLNSEDTISIEATKPLIKQLLNIKELDMIIRDTHLNDILNQTYSLNQLNSITQNFENKYKHYLQKSQPSNICQMTKIIYNQREKVKEKLEKLFQDQNLKEFIQKGQEQLKKVPLETWKNNKKDYEEQQLPIAQTFLNLNRIKKYLDEKKEQETYATGKMNRKKNQMIRIVRKIIKKRRPKTQNEKFCTQVHSRRFIKRIFQLLLSRQESYPEIFYCLTVKFEKKTADKIQFTLNNRFKTYIENDTYIHNLLNEELIKKGYNPVKLNTEQVNLEDFYQCFNLDLQPQEVSEAKIVYEMIVQVYEQKELHRLRLYPIFNCTKFTFLEQQMSQIDTINKYQTPQFLKFKSIVEDIKYYLDTNKLQIEKEAQALKQNQVQQTTEKQQNTKEKLETKVES
ncbi:unnamed protein product [Paramecium primaurelia]|uniref:Uncharacterized protein n=2 Tax=Paramecium primaurelia TaxID=5886 RepID=A0A8S1LPW2_PARPR|nr:unnamed protein product [Paramecium primaurelia]